jgi:hypothetical protein
MYNDREAQRAQQEQKMGLGKKARARSHGILIGMWYGLNMKCPSEGSWC